MKNNGLEILLNGLFWIASGWLIVSGFSIQAQEIELIDGMETVKIVRSEGLIVKLLIATGVSLLLFYLNLWNVSRLAKKVQKSSLLLISATLFLAALGLYLGLERFNLMGFELPLPLTLSIGIITFYFTISTTYGLLKVWIVTEQNQQQLAVAKKQAELNLLRNQLQPHFLFNALNNLLAMVDQQQSPQLANAFERLSLLLRYVIDETKAQKVSLAREIDFIRNYAALQSLRFESNEVNFNLSITGAYEQQTVEPGLFIPFVENAFKYGTEPEHQANIDLHFDLSRKNEIHFSIKNTVFSTYQTKESPGTGIKATKERLRLVYPDKHELRISPQGDSFLVELKLVSA